MSKLSAGEVEIVLDGETRVLRPTLAAMSTLSRMHGGLGGVRDALVAQNFDVVCNVIRHGLGLKDADEKPLRAKVWRTAMDGALLIPLIRYVAILGNGGRPLDEEEAAAGDDGQAGGDAEGNG